MVIAKTDEVDELERPRQDIIRANDFTFPQDQSMDMPSCR